MISSRLLRRARPLSLLFALLLLAGPAAAARDRAPSRPAFSPSSNYAAYVLGEIVEAAETGHNPRIYRAHVDAAHAVFINGHEAIVYNPLFLNDINAQTGTNWAAVSVIAHELGHLVNDDARSGIDGQSSEELHTRELDADYFSGFVMARMGATQADAEATQRLLFDNFETHTHPSSERRLQAIGEGWRDATSEIQRLGNSVALLDDSRVTPSRPRRATRRTWPSSSPFPAGNW